MTGYGRCEEICGGRKILAEIRSVNHRYSDYSVKVPRNYGFLEERLKADAAGYIFRGKVDIFVSVENPAGGRTVTVNRELAEEYVNALRFLRDEFDLEDDISVSLVSGFQDIFKAESAEEDPEEVYAAVRPVFMKAVEEFTASRKREGEKMYADLRARMEGMRRMLAKIEELSPKSKEEYRKKLENKIRELLGDRTADESRILTEVAIFADKIAVDEETVRLSGHFDEFCRILDAGEPAGRRLDFLVQEINREINTIGSKSADINISGTVIDLKAETEKIREQIQNIE